MVALIGRETAGEVPPVLNGDDIMRLAGVAAGPSLGRLIKKLRNAQLNGEIKTTEEATALLVGSSLL